MPFLPSVTLSTWPGGKKSRAWSFNARSPSLSHALCLQPAARAWRDDVTHWLAGCWGFWYKRLIKFVVAWSSSSSIVSSCLNDDTRNTVWLAFLDLSGTCGVNLSYDVTKNLAMILQNIISWITWDVRLCVKYFCLFHDCLNSKNHLESNIFNALFWGT